MNLTHLLLFKYNSNINCDFLFNFVPPFPFRFYVNNFIWRNISMFGLVLNYICTGVGVGCYDTAWRLVSW